MKPEKLILELEQLLEQTGYHLRKERGAFRGNDCLLEGDKIVIINKNKPAEYQAGTIARVLGQIDLSAIYIKPAVKKELMALWGRLSVTPRSVVDELDFD